MVDVAVKKMYLFQDKDKTKGSLSAIDLVVAALYRSSPDYRNSSEP